MKKKRRINVAYVSTYDATDVNNWSGLGFHIAETIRQHVGDVTCIGGLKDPTSVRDRLLRKAYATLAGCEYAVERTERAGREYAKEVEHRLAGGNFDVIIAPGSIPVAYLTTQRPILIYADATFASMVGYYFTNLCSRSIEDGHRMERAAYERASGLLFASEWAAASAVRDYGVAADRVHIVPFGANLRNIPDRRALKNGLSDPIRLLFVGKDWGRKGGDVAYEVLQLLDGKGVRCTLDVVGCDPRPVRGDARVVVHPYLDKNKPTDADRLSQLFALADFFLFPTRQECFGVVICEAYAHGVPVLTHRTGGPASIVTSGRNGFLSDNNAPESYMRFILENRAPVRYRRLRAAARRSYEETFNWNVAGTRIRRIVDELLS